LGPQCIHKYIHIHILTTYTYTYNIHICTYIHTYYTCIRTYIHMCMHTPHTNTNTHAHTHIYIFTETYSRFARWYAEGRRENRVRADGMRCASACWAARGWLATGTSSHRTRAAMPSLRLCKLQSWRARQNTLNSSFQHERIIKQNGNKPE